MAHGNDRDIMVAALAFRFRSASLVMGLEAFKKLLVALFKGVAGFSVVEVTISEEWDGAHDELGLAMHVFEREHFLFRKLCSPCHMDIECAEQSPWCVEKRRGVMIAGRNDDMLARALLMGDLIEEAVVERLSLIGRETAVKNIAGDNYCPDCRFNF